MPVEEEGSPRGSEEVEWCNRVGRAQWLMGLQDLEKGGCGSGSVAVEKEKGKEKEKEKEGEGVRASSDAGEMMGSETCRWDGQWYDGEEAVGEKGPNRE